MHPILKVEILDSYLGLPEPGYAHDGDSGFDLRCVEPVTLYPGQTKIVKTGLKMAVQHGYEVQVRSRSGLAAKDNVLVLNSPGTVDSGYRGEVGVILCNLGDELVSYDRGTRIAQAVVAPVASAVLLFMEVDHATSRNEGGFGSTGIK